MWAIYNIADARWESPSWINICPTEEEAQALCAFLENKYGGTSDHSFVVVPCRTWTELPQPFDVYTTFCRITLQEDGSVTHTVEDAKPVIPDEDRAEGPRFMETTDNYPEELVTATYDVGHYISVGKPEQYGGLAPFVTVWMYHKDAEPSAQAVVEFCEAIAKASKLLQETFVLQEVVQAPPRPLWKKKDD